MADVSSYFGKCRVLLGRCINEGVYEKQQWVPDTKHEILDRLMGYDPYDDSPYGFGSTSIMDEIEEITEEQAEAFLIKGQ